ncbi:phospholipase D-like domain-containing protein [Halomicrobium salinisoli]|uniref:phospholipase D-like domain-containing protein n=1 Tax=Halomicrobium salinisoli TaxID=2878391 RepID=UPI001CEFCEDE|nr:phospholipase D-like domain-containing protein [Halomicrobium salinisoli]
MAGRTSLVLLAVLLVSAAATPALAGPAPPAGESPSVLVGTTDAAATPNGTSGPDRHPRIVAAYPDPVRSGDAGEFAVLSVPPDANLSRYELSDGHRSASLANATGAATGRKRIAVSADPAVARNLTDRSVAGVDALSLANDGGRLALSRNGSLVDEAVYRETTEGSVVRWNGTATAWRPLGATDREPVSARNGEVRAFVLPDAPGVPLDVLAGADDRLLLAGYTLTSERVVDALVRAHERGATVRVLVEGDPVGGRTAREADALDRLSEAGVEVRAVGGEGARYDYHHAKYAVADDRAVVLTENWKPAGTGGNSSRGWGAVTRQEAVVAGLAETFRADAGWRDARPWREYRRGRSFERGEPAVGDYPSRVEPERLPVDRTTLLVAPDNAQSRLIQRLDGADESVDVIQVGLGEWDAPLVRALRRAAARDVEVRVLLSGAWYAREENRQTAERLREWADRRDASLSVRLAEPGDRFEKIHAKGAVIDDRHVVLGSLNWNEAAATSNREVLLVLSGERVAGYYGGVFDADWRGGSTGLPVGVLAALGGVLVLAGLVAWRMEFVGEEPVGVGP